MIPFVGFYPDADEHDAGVITDCEMMLPSMKGYRSAPSLTPESAALPAECVGATYVTKLDNTTRLFAGTQTDLYEYIGSAWASVGSGYLGSSDSVWRFSQFGNVTIAVNGSDPMQHSVDNVPFTDLAGAPSGQVVETVGGFVMTGNYGAYGATEAAPDGVAWSAFQNYADWTPAVATQAGNQRLLDTPGEVRAIKRLGGYAVVYKKNSMYLGVNNGPPVLWGFTLISSEIGVPSQEALVSIETAHYFISETDIFMYDGSRPIPIGAGIREWFFDDLSPTYAYKIRGVYDKSRALIYWYYPSRESQGQLDSCIVYNHKTRKWGRANREIQCCLEYLTASLTYDDLEADYPTYDQMPMVSYNSPFWTDSSFNMAVFDVNGVLATLTGEDEDSSITTGAIGLDSEFALVSRVQPRFIDDSDTAEMTNYYRFDDGATYITDKTVAMNKNRFDVLRAGRWHKFKFNFSGKTELNGATYRIQVEGGE